MFHNLQIDDNLPDIKKINFKSIEKKFLALQIIKFFVIFGVITAGLFYFFYSKIAINIPEYLLYFYLGFCLIFAFILLLIILGFFKRKYAIRQKDITFRHGVLVHSITTIPFSRIQHLEIGEGVFERIFKLATLNVYTAGDNGRDLKISGLNKKKATGLKEIITNYLEDESE